MWDIGLSDSIVFARFYLQCESKIPPGVI